MEESIERVTLGRRLKQATERAKVSNEINEFSQKLINAADLGEESVVFDDLRIELPTLIMNGTIWEWFKAEELYARGGVDQNTGAYRYTVSW